ncbi:hydrolase TatD [Pedobacter yulinensis]|uniref:Hydrolase TatD n=1 Tax=Pedobacter yulinensis TaxID=2126353 RepID=A0A2T3HRC5_9SPHI|nr:TatD family hydrolase [Pedobacter yulinensis]PST84979.1 hydrolase TatD [Pedobacter yulinensis]
MYTSYLDLHTHQTLQPAGVQRVFNVDVTAESEELPGGWFSCGIHPWHAELTYESNLTKLRALAAMPEARLIGECGLDKLRGPAMKVQLQTLGMHVKLAEDMGKPLIIHCVRAFSELLDMRKRLKINVPVIIHGFNKKPELARQLERQGFMLSVGSAACKPGSGAAAYAAAATGPFFLETDDAGMGIDDVYAAVANLRKISVEALKDRIFANWKKFNLIDV